MLKGTLLSVLPGRLLVALAVGGQPRRAMAQQVSS